MRVLVTSSRMPIATEAIRKLGRTGHTVLASDPSKIASAGHSRFVKQRFVTASPRYDTPGFVDDIATILSDQPVDMLLPTFEEVFFLARHRERLEPLTELFFPAFETLRTFHNKAAFLEFAAGLGIPVHPHLVASSRDELAAATKEFNQFIAHATYSRGGLALFTNAGPLAGRVSLDDCAPTPENPYIVQPYVPGVDLCTYSIVHHGRVAGHAAYVHPIMLDYSSGLTFESVVDEDALAIARNICEATGFHGQISFDFMRTSEGLVLIEANPRATSGLAMLPDEMFIDALRNRLPGEVLVAPAGVHRKLSLGLLRNLIARPRQGWRNLDAFVHAGKDLLVDFRDPVPSLYELAFDANALFKLVVSRGPDRMNVMEAYVGDLLWNGEEIA